MRRRSFLVLSGSAALSAPLAVRAQPARKPVIGVLFHSNPEPTLGELRASLAGLGYRDGDTAELNVLVADGSAPRLAAMAAELVARKVDVIVAVTTPAVLAAKAATADIPIVMGGVADPVGSGVVTSLARPGGNITGVSAAIAEIAGKILGLMRDVLPAAKRIGVLVNTADPFYLTLIEHIEAANRIVRIDLRVFRVAGPGELPAAFEAMVAEGVDAAIVQPTLPRQVVIALSIRHRLPTASPIRGYADDGGLFSYNGKIADTFAVAAGQVDRIFKGARPADIPVQRPTKFELVLNLKVAKTLGIDISPALLAQVDEVIE